MIDIISLSIAVGAVLVSLTTHIKFSKCWGFELQTRALKNSPPDTPILNHTESTALMSASNPIPIPDRPVPNKNYL